MAGRPWCPVQVVHFEAKNQDQCSDLFCDLPIWVNKFGTGPVWKKIKNIGCRKKYAAEQRNMCKLTTINLPKCATQKRKKTFETSARCRCENLYLGTFLAKFWMIGELCFSRLPTRETRNVTPNVTLFHGAVTLPMWLYPQHISVSRRNHKWLSHWSEHINTAGNTCKKVQFDHAFLFETCLMRIPKASQKG